MDQYFAIRKVRDILRKVITETQDMQIVSQLQEADERLDYFFKKGIDFKEIVDNLDESVFITDADGNVIYINEAYTHNTDITAEEVLNHNVSELIGKDKVYTGGAVPDVLQTKKSAFRLSTTYKNNMSTPGYVSGTPIFDENGELYQVVACSRPIISLKLLKDDFSSFIEEINKLERKTITKNSEEKLSPSMIGRDTTLAPIWSLISQVAATDATVLITGESGAGKEVIADEVFRNSRRSQAPYVKINCASIPPQLLESELFGYEKGAFSGANVKGKVGLFELANNGTLMLDEIGDMPMDLQAKLLRALQSREITRVGGTKPIKLDIRILALTNCNLKDKIAEGTFRQDLFYRLNVIPIKVPPLRERTEDIAALCQHFIDIFSQKYEREFALSERQLQMLQQYAWPGNIRELENIIEYLVLCSSGIGHTDDAVIMNLLNISMEDQKVPGQAALDMAFDTNLDTAVSQFEKQLLEKVLAESSNLREAGQKLGLNASTVSRKIKQYNIPYAGRK